MSTLLGFSHPRGDGPFSGRVCIVANWFSPPAWGWSEFQLQFLCYVPSFPHPRGDGPRCQRGKFSCDKFSPPAWGWSAFVLDPTDGRFPHPRGDGPPESPSASRNVRFSPPAWGWSAGQSSSDQLPDVPHPRDSRTGRRAPPKFSPPAWGWSETVASYQRPGGVFPTRVGGWSVDRPLAASTQAFSPPAWGGWSDCTADAGKMATVSGGPFVFPTRVGMVRSRPTPQSLPRFPHPRGGMVRSLTAAQTS